MNVLHVCGWFDPAGDTVRCVDELKRFSKHEHQFVVRERHPLQKIMQLPEPPPNCWGTPSQRLVDWADVILCHFTDWPDDWPDVSGKPIGFRNLNINYDRDKDLFWSEPQYTSKNPAVYDLVSASHVGAMDIVGTERFRWLPDLLPMDRAEYMPDFTERPHAVSYIKQADYFDFVDFGAHVTKLSLANRPHSVIMRLRKHQATIIIDNTIDGHWGLAGNEALSLGLPCIVFNHPRTHKALRELVRMQGGTDVLDAAVFPFAEASCQEHAAEIVRELAGWPNDMFQSLRRDLRHWAERHFASSNLIPRFWDTFFRELATARQRKPENANAQN